MNDRAKIVLQNRLSLLYLKESGEWTPDLSEAVDFTHVMDASSFAHRSEPGNLDIVMTFGDPRYDVRLPASA